MKTHKTTYKTQLMTWGTLRTCILTLGDLTPHVCKDGKTNIAIHVQEQVAMSIAAATSVLKGSSVAAAMTKYKGGGGAGSSSSVRE